MRIDPPRRRLSLPGVMGIFMLIYGGTIEVFAVESLIGGDMTGIGSFLLGAFVVVAGAISDRDRHRDYVAEAQREEALEREANERKP